jgi:NADPH-dependent glutamate synthase beta subunit-like oxidoreductase
MASQYKVPKQLVLHNINYADLSSVSGLCELDTKFIAFLQKNDAELSASVQQYRHGLVVNKVKESELLIDIAKHLEAFIVELFHLGHDIKLLREQSLALDPIITFKKLVILKECKKYQRNIAEFPDFDYLHNWLQQELQQYTADFKEDMELAVAKLALSYFVDREKSAEKIANIAMWACYCLHDKDAKSIVANWISFKVPQKIVHDELIKTLDHNNTKYMPAAEIEPRDGFALTDEGMGALEIKSELNHCIYCHDKGGDFCSTGFYNKKSKPELGYKTNAHANELLGCPLEQKISEMNVLKQEGLAIASLAMLMLDNPMCPLTGHRICNDCMQACVYQKQDPVDIPQIESRILKDVLELPWGVEIYDLFTKWNPLSNKDWVMQPYNGYKVMVMGMGPAGIAMAHYLLTHGCAVVGADGAKMPRINKLELQHPVYDFDSLVADLSKHDLGGFGGVAKYGITARWNKQLLKLVYLSLARKKHFNIIGSTRFGGTITIDDASQMGFDHLAVAVGAGLPKAINIPGSLAPGVISANSFLMSLHLNGAISDRSITDLQIELPAIVIGGGLTGVDTATEVQAYYIKQVERIYDQYTLLAKTTDLNAVFAYVGDDAKLKLFLQHGAEAKDLRQQALKAESRPNFSELVQRWGAVKIVYRKRMQDSPAYKNNYYELEQALKEGVLYMENLSPEEFLLDENGSARGLQVRNIKDDSVSRIAAKTILFATGSKPNVAYGFEHAGDIERKSFSYVLYREVDGLLQVDDVAAKHCKSKDLAFFSSYSSDGKRVSVIGDTNPAFHGSVVKALASAKHAAPIIMQSMFHHLSPKSLVDYEDFEAKILAGARAKIVNISEVVAGVKKITIKAPLAIKNHCVGNFFRLQNYEANGTAPDYLHPIAAFPSDVDKDAGIFSFYLLASYENNLISNAWEEGSSISVMGPSGVKASMPKTPGNIILFLDYSQIGSGSYIAAAMKQQGHQVEIIVDIGKGQNIYAEEELIDSCDRLLFVTNSSVDYKLIEEKVDIFEGDMAGSLLKEHSFGIINLQSADMVVIKGVATFVAKIKNLRFGQLKSSFVRNPKTTALVLGPMNCMLKGICAQCLQWQIDPITELRTKEVYACSWQDQPLEVIAVDHLLERDKTKDNVVTRLNKMLQDSGINELTAD